MMSIAFKEGLKIPPPAMNELILAANQDIRQVSSLSRLISDTYNSVYSFRWKTLMQLEAETIDVEIGGGGGVW